MTLDQLLSLPWTIRGPLKVDADDGTWWEITIEELPDFFVADETREDALREYLPALKAFLASYVDRGQVPPLPANQNVWRSFMPPLARRSMRIDFSKAGSYEQPQAVTQPILTGVDRE